MSKVLWNSVLSTKFTESMGIDTKHFYLETPLDYFEYTKMPLSIFPQHTIDEYNWNQHPKNLSVYLEIRQAIYGLPQAGLLTSKLLRRRLPPTGYYKCVHMPDLWRYVTRPFHPHLWTRGSENWFWNQPPGFDPLWYRRRAEAWPSSQDL